MELVDTRPWTKRNSRCREMGRGRREVEGGVKRTEGGRSKWDLIFSGNERTATAIVTNRGFLAPHHQEVGLAQRGVWSGAGGRDARSL
ncbi:MAG: hypothetical protein M1826_002346 [Phylliscum demangeonii]|nr:MAG: hypothetical protein M1826_002346 [Phylliscum demangeonii]